MTKKMWCWLVEPSLYCFLSNRDFLHCHKPPSKIQYNKVKDDANGAKMEKEKENYLDDDCEALQN